MLFSDLGLEPELLRAVTAQGYDTPTPIQAQSIPAVLAGRDVLAGAQTGTGKTASFVLPLLQILRSAHGKVPRVLVLSPTRELSAQIEQSCRTYGQFKNLRTTVIFGGVSERPQIDALRHGCDILVATPGRLLDLADRRFVDLSGVNHLVLDEADRMLDMGFLPAIRRVLNLLPKQRQNLLFSATYNNEVRELAAKLLRDPAQIQVTPRNSTVERVDQLAMQVPKDHKRHVLAHVIREGIGDEGPWPQVLVFTRTKHGANRLAEQLVGGGIPAAAIHGNKSQNARVKALADFKDGRIVALVATDVASRGLDIKELPYVVNYELPNVPEDYVHRIGRTARAGAEGCALSLVSGDEVQLLRDIERVTKQRVPNKEVPAFTIQASQPPPPPASRPAGRPPGPSPSRTGGRGSGNGGGRPQGRSGSGRSGSGRSGSGRGGGGWSSGRG